MSYITYCTDKYQAGHYRISYTVCDYIVIDVDYYNQLISGSVNRSFSVETVNRNTNQFIHTVYEAAYVAMDYNFYEQLLSNSVGAPENSFIMDSEIYTEVSGYMLLAFISGHILGKIVRMMGRI